MAIAAVALLGRLAWPADGPLRIEGGAPIGPRLGTQERLGTLAFEDGSALTFADEPSLVTL